MIKDNENKRNFFISKVKICKSEKKKGFKRISIREKNDYVFMNILQELHLSNMKEKKHIKGLSQLLFQYRFYHIHM